MKPRTSAVARILRPTWFEIDLDAIAHNLRQLRRMVGPGVAIYACLKRNAYGCGAVPVAGVMQREGADAIAVGNIDDALAIREAQVTCRFCSTRTAWPRTPVRWSCGTD